MLMSARAPQEIRIRVLLGCPQPRTTTKGDFREQSMARKKNRGKKASSAAPAKKAAAPEVEENAPL